MKITVFYDGACPLCTREVEKWRGAPFNCQVEWFDITEQDEVLLAEGIDPQFALLELHTKTSDGVIRTSIESYALLLAQLPRWQWLGSLMSLPVVKPLLKSFYDFLTKVRLKKDGRWQKVCSNKNCK